MGNKKTLSRKKRVGGPLGGFIMGAGVERQRDGYAAEELRIVRAMPRNLMDGKKRMERAFF